TTALPTQRRAISRTRRPSAPGFSVRPSARPGARCCEFPQRCNAAQDRGDDAREVVLDLLGGEVEHLPAGVHEGLLAAVVAVERTPVDGLVMVAPALDLD